MCTFDLKSQIQSGKTKVGIIFNLDPHNKGGSHWVALFVDCKKHKIYYFDSYGDPIPERIMRLVKTIKEQAREMKKSFLFIITTADISIRILNVVCIVCILLLLF